MDLFPLEDLEDEESTFPAGTAPSCELLLLFADALRAFLRACSRTLAAGSVKMGKPWPIEGSREIVEKDWVKRRSVSDTVAPVSCATVAVQLRYATTHTHTHTRRTQRFTTRVRTFHTHRSFSPWPGGVDFNTVFPSTSRQKIGGFWV